MKFSIKYFFSKCDQIRSFLRIWADLLKKPLMENFIFYAVWHVQTFWHQLLGESDPRWFSCNQWLVRRIQKVIIWQVKPSVIRQKDESRNSGYKKTKHAKFSKKQTRTGTILSKEFQQKVLFGSLLQTNWRTKLADCRLHDKNSRLQNGNHLNLYLREDKWLVS